MFFLQNLEKVIPLEQRLTSSNGIMFSLLSLFVHLVFHLWQILQCLYSMLEDICMVIMCSYVEMVWNSLQLVENVVLLICIRMHRLTRMSLQVSQTLPTQFIRDYGTKFHKKSFLRMKSCTKTWWVRFCVQLTRRGTPEVAFSSGWKAFAHDNRLREGDKLIFVLNAQSVSFFQMYLFRASSRRI